MMGYEESLSADAEYPEDDKNHPDGYEEDYRHSGSKEQRDVGHRKANEGSGFDSSDGGNPGTDGSGGSRLNDGFDDFEEESTAKHIGTMSVRFYLSDREKNIYNLIFIPRKSAGSGYLQIHLSGEQNKVKASIVSAVDTSEGAPLKCRGNRVYLHNIQKAKKNKVTFRLEYVEECSMEVKLYGYTS